MTELPLTGNIARWIEGLERNEPALAWTGHIQPVPLGRPRRAPNHPGLYLEEKDRAFREELQQLWMIGRLRPVKGPIAVHIMLFGHGQQYDLDNYQKAIGDAGNGFLWEDDRQIKLLLVGFGEWGPAVQPSISVRVWHLGGNDA